MSDPTENRHSMSYRSQGEYKLRIFPRGGNTQSFSVFQSLNRNIDYEA